MKLELTLRALGGIARRDQLLAVGLPPAAIAAALRAETAIRLRRSWFGLPETPYPHRAAVELGGRVAGLTAAKSYGLWAGANRGIHVSWAPHGNIAKTRLRESAQIVRHWRIMPESGWPELWRESPEQAIAQVLLSSDRTTAIAVVDSALHNGILNTNRLEAILARMPGRVRGWHDQLDGRADSGLETIARLWIHDLGVLPLVHPSIAGLEVDLLVGTSLVIELDGEEFHSGADAFERDRARDATLSSVGCIVIRFSYHQVMLEPALCLARIREHVARGDHLRRLLVPVVLSPEFREASGRQPPRSRGWATRTSGEAS
jgi:hypothetical protein